YSLFIVSRYRELLADGVDTEEAAARSVATAGGAVVFAGLTVMIALFGLSVAGIHFLASMGAWAAVAVGLTVVVALTLTPALLGFAGHRLAPKARRKAGESPATRFFTGWVRGVTRRPVVSILAVVIGLGIVAAPALGLRLALPDAGA